MSSPKHVLPRKIFHQFFLVLLIFRLIALSNHSHKALKPNSINYWLVDKFNFQKLIRRFSLDCRSTSSWRLSLCSLGELGLNLLVKNRIRSKIEGQNSCLFSHLIMTVLVFSCWRIPIRLSVKLDTIKACLDVKLTFARTGKSFS